MNASNQPTEKSGSKNSASDLNKSWSDLISPDLCLSLATVPVLLGVTSISALAATLREIGELSEEIFRGDRLPLLDFPAPSEPDPGDSKSP